MRMMVDKATGERPVPGDMWFVHPTDKWPQVSPNYLSDYYYAHNAHRLPLQVVLPTGDHFTIDAKCTSDGKMYGGWTVTGEPPRITVAPSISMGEGGSIWHGYLQGGVLKTL